MDFRLGEQDEAFRKEVQDFLTESLPPDWLEGIDRRHEELKEEVYQIGIDIRHKLAAKGWLGIGWPKEYGGQGAPLTRQMILEDEIAYRVVPGYDLYAMVLVGPLILQFGTEEQKMRFIPPMTRGTQRWSIGMSEPNAGSDLAALQTRAVDEGEYFVVSGQKTWQSGAHHADWCILYARSDFTAPKHRGISVFLVDLKSPGITMRRISQIGDLSILSEVFYDNVRVPKENLLGRIDGGWDVALASLGSERTFGILFVNDARREFEHLVKYCRETHVDGQPLGKDPIVRNRLAEMDIQLEVARNLSHRIRWMAIENMPMIATANEMKVLGSTLIRRVATLGMQILGQYGQLAEGSKWARLRGKMNCLYLGSLYTISEGGTTEVARNAIATIGLGLPRQ